MKKAYIYIISLLSLGFTFAAPAKFEITVLPSFKVNEYVDLTIKAITTDGKTDTSYKGQDISIDITDESGKTIGSADVVLPSNGYGYFEASDLGVKIYSKGLALKKPGKYIVSVSDIFKTSIKGSTGFTVTGEGTGPVAGTIKVSSPTPNSTETNAVVTIIGTTSTPNTPLSLVIDDKKTKEGVSDANGGFSIALSGLTPGKHTLIVNGMDLGNTIVSTSGPIPFSITAPDTTALTAILDIQPSKTVAVNTNVTFTITTKASATSASIIIGNATPLPTTKVSDGVFQKEVNMQTPGTFPISVEVTAGDTKKFDNLDTVTVQDSLRKILTLNGSLSTDGSTASLSWTATGTINFYKVQYGLSRDDMKLSLTTTKQESQIPLNIPGTRYYAQIYPIDQAGIVNGEPSQVIEIKPQTICGNGKIETGEECDDGNTIENDSCNNLCRTSFNAPTATCGNGVVDAGETCDDGNALANDGCNQCQEETCNPPAGIQLKTKKIGNQYYLYRGSVPGAVKYMIYRKDSQPSNNSAIGELSLIGDTTETQYAYPFDPTANADQYARYAVQAVCQNGQQQMLDSIKKVKVGPRETLMVLLLILSVLMYGFMRQRI